MNKKPKVLFLADTTHPASAVTDHIQAITSGQLLDFYVVNPLVNKTMDKFDLDSFDAIGIHYSIKPYNNYYLSRSLQKKIAEYNGTKFLFLQDEYQRVNEVQDFLFNLNFHLLFTLVDERFLAKAYPDKRLDKLVKIPVLTAYVTDEMKTWGDTPISQRPIDVSYRGRKYEYWLGSLAYEKELIASQFIQHTQQDKLSLDISLEESTRVYGNKWLELLKQSRTVLGTESGASIWDFDRSIEIKTKKYLKHNRSANFDQVFQNVLKPYDGIIMYSAISPRIFEAAATKTPMIMFPGYYNGICKPNEHYIPLEKDFSNIKDVVARLKDTDYLQSLADHTFNDLILSGKYSQHQFANLIEQEIFKLIKPKHSSVKSINLDEQLEKHKQIHKHINALRRIVTESLFICEKFWGLLTDPRNNMLERINFLVKGLRRYLVYLFARFAKQN